MGDRGQVKVIGHNGKSVYLYTHWKASSLVETVREALDSQAGRNRWDDVEYLTRIIFDYMTGLQREETGYGIGTTAHGDVWRIVEVNVEKQTVTIFDDGEFIGFYSFKNFVR